MQIHNPNNLPTVDYRSVKDFQGNLKDLSTPNHDKLLRVLEKRGFIFPFHIWEHDGSFYLLDGHQRHRVMSLNELSDDGNYHVPYIRVEAPDEKTAKEILLEDTSQYGTITVDGLDEYLELAELGDLDVNFDAVNLDKLVSDIEASEEVAKSKVDKLSSWTFEALVDLATLFTEQNNSDSLQAFMQWLEMQ